MEEDKEDDENEKEKEEEAVEINKHIWLQNNKENEEAVEFKGRRLGDENIEEVAKVKGN